MSISHISKWAANIELFPEKPSLFSVNEWHVLVHSKKPTAGLSDIINPAWFKKSGCFCFQTLDVLEYLIETIKGNPVFPAFDLLPANLNPGQQNGTVSAVQGEFLDIVFNGILKEPLVYNGEYIVGMMHFNHR